MPTIDGTNGPIITQEEYDEWYALCHYVAPPGMVYCYECQVGHPANEMQERPCSLCEGSKCKALHGGAVMHTCKRCGSIDLCADCVSFGECCNKNNNEIKTKEKQDVNQDSILRCVDCNCDYPASKVQAIACSVCNDRKCKALHGGKEIYTCDDCNTKELCIDCVSSGKCCAISEKF